MSLALILRSETRPFASLSGRRLQDRALEKKERCRPIFTATARKIEKCGRLQTARALVAITVAIWKINFFAAGLFFAARQTMGKLTAALALEVSTGHFRRAAR